MQDRSIFMNLLWMYWEPVFRIITIRVITAISFTRMPSSPGPPAKRFRLVN